MMNKEIKELKKQMALLQSRIEELERNNSDDDIDYHFNLESTIAEYLGLTLEDEEHTAKVDKIINFLSQLLDPEIASYIAGVHVGVSLSTNSMTGINERSSYFYESFIDNFDKVGFEQFNLGVRRSYYADYHYLDFSVLVDSLSSKEPANKFLFQFTKKVKDLGLDVKITHEAFDDILEKYLVKIQSLCEQPDGI